MSPPPSEPFNVLFIIADDMTAFMMGCAGSSFYETPHLDAFASRAQCFSQAYGTGPVCTPSRASLLTGKHPARLNITNYTPGSVPENPRKLTPEWTPYLSCEEVTLANRYAAAGYATGHFGKWHLNRDYQHYPNRPMDPETQGFQEVFTTVKPKPGADPEDDAHNARAITQRTVDFLERHQAEPFFCVVEHNLVHRPEMESRALVEKYRQKSGSDLDYQRPELGAMVERLDWSVGVLLEKLDTLGLSEKTWVIFTADHGSPGNHDDDRPLHGAKATLYEGGIRVPLIIQGPGDLAAGRVHQTRVTGADVAVTLGQAVDPELDLTELDGVDLFPLLSGKISELPSRPLGWHFPHYHHQGLGPCGAVIVGNDKLVEWFDPEFSQRGGGAAFELFNLEEDPGECTNLACLQPEKVAALRNSLGAWRRAVGAQEMLPNPSYDPDQPTLLATPGH